MNGRVNRGLVYIFDFGLCRQYKNTETGRLREQRQSAPFRGTVRYASIDVLSVSLYEHVVSQGNNGQSTHRGGTWGGTTTCGRCCT